MPEARPARLAYRPEIDGLRAVAVLAVIANHFHREVLPSGYLGVDIFFVISGFVICGSLAAPQAEQTLGRFLLGFYSRRIRRILPALLVCVLITSLLVSLVDPAPTASLQTGLAALLGVSNLFLQQQAVDYFSRSTELNAFLQTWSLGVEEQFYFVFPLMLWLTGFSRGAAAGERRLGLVLAAVGSASLLAYVLLARQQQAAAFFLMPPRFWELGAGALLFLLYRCGRLRGAWQRLPSLLPLGLLLAALCLPLRLQVPATLTVVVLTAAVIAMGLVGQDRRLASLLSHPVAVGIGLLSYSLYLWHWPVLVLSRWTIGLSWWTLPLQVGLMAALAMGSYHAVERPLRRRPWAPSQGLTLVCGLLAAAFTAVPVWALKDPFRQKLYLGQIQPTKSERFADLVVPGTTINQEDCLTQSSILDSRATFARFTERCSAWRPRPARHLFLVGDSHGTAFLPVATELYREGYGLTLLTRPGCPFPDTRQGHLQRECSRFLQATEAYIFERARPGDTVVIVNYLISHLGDSETLADTRDQFRGVDGQPITGEDRKFEAWRWGLARFASQARSRRLQVVLLGATPRNPEFFTCRQEWFNIQGAQRCDGLVASEQAVARRLNRRIAAALPPGVELMDPLQLLCEKGCSNHQVSWLLRDRDHLSNKGARELTPAFRRMLEQPRE